MRRRTFIAALGSAVVWPLVARAQQAMPVVGLLSGTQAEDRFVGALRRDLEGIVAKRRDRPYRSGRSPDWIKVRNPDAPAATKAIGDKLPPVLAMMRRHGGGSLMLGGPTNRHVA
jgi:ATP-dependent DNA ligase